LPVTTPPAGVYRPGYFRRGG